MTRTEINRLYRAKYPERYKARNTLNNAIRDGKITRQPCAICGSVPAQAHHEDYTQPLTVEWLCRTHHREKDADKHQHQPPRKHPRIPEEVIDQARALRAQGYGYLPIARMLNISVSQLFKRLNKTSYD